MSLKTPYSPKIGYTRREFGLIFQLYSRHVYTGLFRDFRFTEHHGRYFISFLEEAGQTPLITVEKRRLGSDKALFVATTPGLRSTLVEIARSEKIDAFTEELKARLEVMLEGGSTENIRHISCQ